MDKATWTFISGQRLEINQGDLTRQKVDAIVNAANERLQHGGGVAGIIVREGGEIIQRQSNNWVKDHGLVGHDNPAYTSAGSLPAKYVIHAVGPIWGSGAEDQKLSVAISGSLRVADDLHLNSIAFPAISTGIFGFPKERAAGIFMTSIKDYFKNNPLSGVKLVRLVLYDEPTLTAFLKAFHDLIE